MLNAAEPLLHIPDQLGGQPACCACVRNALVPTALIAVASFGIAACFRFLKEHADVRLPLYWDSYRAASPY